jgi:SAM-dependent methyltransferase
MDILRKIGSQFKKPTGLLGTLISDMMIIGNRSAYKNLINDLPASAYLKILEIGYGPGIGIDLISKKFEGWDIYGIDFSELMFRRAAKRNRLLIKNNRVHLFLGDFIDAEIITSGFNVIYCINVVYFWNDLQRPFERVRSLLNDDGMFCFYMASKEELDKIKFTKKDIFNKYSIEQITNALKTAGFGKVEYYFKHGFYIKAKK